jgi:hypothetical protein
MNDKQKLVVFKSALLELGFRSNIEKVKDEDFTIIKIGSFWTAGLIYGRVKKKNGVLTYFMFGAPKTNYKIVNLIQDFLEIEIEKVEFENDTPLNRNDEWRFFL